METIGRMGWKHLLLALLISAGAVSMATNLSRITGGVSDYRAYWAASRLLLQGESFSDQANLLEIQQAETGWSEDWAMKTWNPPWTLVWLFPYSALPFHVSAKIWLLTNMVLLIAGVFISWYLFADSPKKVTHLGLALVLAILYPSALVAMWVGQVSLIVPFAIALSAALFTKSRDFLAGTILSLAMVKPHIAYLAIAFILVISIKQRRWRVLVGFLTSLSISTLVVFVLRPGFIFEYFESTSGNDLLAWQSSTLTTYLQAHTGQQWIRLLGIPLALVASYFFYRKNEHDDFLFLVCVTMLLSIITAPFGWSYDFVVLLLPITAIAVVISRTGTSRLLKLFITVALLIIYTAFFIQRVREQNELNYFWIPLAIGLLFGIVAYLSDGRYLISRDDVSSEPQIEIQHTVGE